MKELTATDYKNKEIEIPKNTIKKLVRFKESILG